MIILFSTIITSMPNDVFADVYLKIPFISFANFLPISSLTCSISKMSDLLAAMAIAKKFLYI